MKRRIPAESRNCDKETPAFTVRRRLQPYKKKHPPANADPSCQQLDPWADTRLQQKEWRVQEQVQSWERLPQLRGIDSVKSTRILNQLQKRGTSPFLHPVPEEVGDYIHVYWTNHFRDYLDEARQHVEEQLQSNWLYYHPTQERLPDAVLRTYMTYILEPAYRGVANFICNNDYREFYLSRELIHELVEETLRGNLVQSDSLRYMLRVLEQYPLSSIQQLVREFPQESVSSSAVKLIQWLEEHEEIASNNNTSGLRQPLEWKLDVQRLFVQQMVWLRLYPQRALQEYEQELHSMLDTIEPYEPGQMRQLLAFRLRDRDYYYNNLLPKWSKDLKHKVLGLTPENLRLFLLDLEFFTVPFSYDSQQVREPVRERNVSGHEVVILIEKEVNPVVHPLLTNLFLPLPSFSPEAIQQLLTTQLVLERRICGRHHQAVLEGQLAPFRDVSGVIPVFQEAPMEEHIFIRAHPSRGLCTPVVVSATVEPYHEKYQPLRMRPATTKKIVTYTELARGFVATWNRVNRDDLRTEYSKAYSDLTQRPHLLTYTSAYGPRVTERLLQLGLRAQIEKQLERFWNSVEARFVLHERLTPVYTLLSVALHPSFHVFLSPEEQEMLSLAWEGFEASVQPFVQSPQACKPSPPLSRPKELKCVLINSALLMKQPPQRLRDYLGKDIAQGA